MLKPAPAPTEDVAASQRSTGRALDVAAALVERGVALAGVARPAEATRMLAASDRRPRWREAPASKARLVLRASNRRVRAQHQARHCKIIQNYSFSDNVVKPVVVK